MTRTILSIAIALAAVTALFASAAEACISCSYVPEVVNTPSPSYGAKTYQKKRVHIASKQRQARPAKTRVARNEPAARKAEKTVETAASAPVETQPETASRPITTASLDEGTPPAEEPKAQANVGCKKFFPAVGMTVTVPCE